ncbi:tRNA (adenosine(37)-N6)-threonylcarbamoyltransferase complex transferase subunit TsaD [Acidicapsa dinghuensis]|uniref:tRNA N6-adenosine threonylcarbamoyltransferase n=1 Tax=Acidicapsa dinghuensis TaxID=2218256 RepID=A0ABW1EBX5_9BACT|nr:tRNA (adenosine(37)-N6)-threonylcarbamoyltransferase complex transferase subunit TsaD [Acidicapsa dinghuensis]
MASGLILGIESSCDETAAAVVERGSLTRSSIVASQIGTHAPYGGVVPELASREHLRNIVPITRAALEQAGCELKDIEAVAVTSGPGLAGALLVGLTYAKTLAFSLGVPLISVNHLEGHIHAVLLAENRDQGSGTREQGIASGLPMPALALVVSGGHTHLFLARPPEGIAAGQAGWRYELIGRTLDDAAGEAYDKVAKLLGLGYPGGPWIDNLAQYGNAKAVPFTFAQIKPKAHLEGKAPRTKGATIAPIGGLNRHFLFSFSGIKTAVLRYVEVHGMRAACEERMKTLSAMPHAAWQDALPWCDKQTLDLIASFQHAVVGDLMKKTFAAAEAVGAASVLVTGGVAANRELRVRFTAEAAERGLPIAFPTLALSTDNAAMIAAAAWPRFVAGEFADWDLEANPRMVLA